MPTLIGRYTVRKRGWTKVLYADQNNSMLTSVVSGTSGIKKAAKDLYECLRAAQTGKAA